MPEEAKLIHFTNTVVQEATEEAERTLRELEERKTAALAEARRKAEQEAVSYIRGETARIHTECGREVSRHLMACKREVYLRRSQISSEVFGRVKERIYTFTGSPEYAKRLESQLISAVGQFGLVADVTVYLRPEDMSFAQSLAQSVKPVDAAFLPGSFTLGGLIVDCPETGQRIDASYDTALSDLSGRFAELFGLSLADDLSNPGKDDSP